MKLKLDNNFYNNYRGLVRSAIHSLVKDPEVADDVESIAWVAILESLHTYDAARPIGPWITTVASRAAYRYLTTDYEDRVVMLDADMTYVEDDTEETDPGSWIEQHVESPYFSPENEAVLLELYHKHASLSDREAAVFNLVYWHGHSYQSVAEHLGIEMNSIGPLVGRMREKLETNGRVYYGRTPHYHKPANPWADWSWKPEGLGNLRMEKNYNNETYCNGDCS